MDQPERFSLEWSEYEINLRKSFADLRREEHFSDVTLVSEDGRLVKAHKVLLSSSSSLLDTILKGQDHPKPLIFMRGAKTDVLNSVLDFIYYGKVEIRGDRLNDFMALADELKVKGLSKQGEEYEENGENDPKTTIEDKKVKKTHKLGINEDIGTEDIKSECIEMEEVKSAEGSDMSGNADLKNTTMKLFYCNICGKTSTTLQGLERHTYRYHPVRKEKIPEANEKEEDTNEKDTKGDFINMSENLIMGDKMKSPFDCNLCEKTSLTIKGLQRHKYRYHSAEMAAVNLKTEAEEKVFSCDLCEKKSRSKAGLYKHKIRRH